MPDVVRFARLALVAALLAGARGAWADEDAFLRIKKMEGAWVAVDEKGQVTDQVVSVFRVTANGHSVEEIMFPGTAREMVNMYYRDGDEVRLTHYCAGGNQPTLRLVPTPGSNVLQLEFVDITNMITIDDEHMHEGQYQWVDENHLRTEWRAFRSGRYYDTSKFEMVRRR
jgi:hypothetical protein